MANRSHRSRISPGSFHREPRSAVHLNQADSESLGEFSQRSAGSLGGQGQVGSARIGGVQGGSRHGFAKVTKVPLRFDDDNLISFECDEVRPPILQQAGVISRGLDLQIDQFCGVAGPARGLGDQLEPERLEPEEDFCVHQRAGVDGENSHGARGFRVRLLSRLGHLD